MMKNKYMIKLAFINIFKKKKRTQLSLIAIILSTAVIFSACILFKNINTFKDMTSTELSNYHYAVVNVEDITLSNRYRLTSESDLSLRTNYGSTEYIFKSLQIQDNILPFILKEGGLPSANNDILVDGSMQVDVGKEVDLSLTNGQTQTYKVVGIYESDALFQTIHNSQAIIYTQSDVLDNMIYYINDEQAHIPSSFDSLLSKLSITSEHVYTNTERVTVDTIKVYMQDTTLIQVFYVVIILLCIGMSLISIHNVLLISDQSRKREIGLLKSVGAGPKAIKTLLHTELFVLGTIGAILGLILGFGVSYTILNQFIGQLYLSFSLSMLYSPIIIAFSFSVGFLLMYISGLKAYQKYVYSTAISDLKENNYDFMPPIKTKTVLASGFGWKMFSIYNRRMKKQTKNIRTSFVLLVVTSVLFLSVIFSSVSFSHKNMDKNYDLELKSTQMSTPQVSYDLYEMIDNKEITITNIQINRTLANGKTPMGFRTSPDSYDDWNNELHYYKKEAEIPYSEVADLTGELWCNVYHYATAFDNIELEKIEPYVVEGSIENLSSQEVIAVFQDSFGGAQFCDNFKVGDIVAFYPLVESEPTPPISTQVMKRDYGRKLAAIVHLPMDVANQLGYPFDQYDRIMAFALESVGSVQLETIQIGLKNPASSIDAQEKIEKMLMEVNSLENYEIYNVALEIENNRFTSFIIQVLLIPLFLMLFAVSLMNIHNVLSGNVLLKQNDIAIMRSVGMNKKQLRLIILYEYLEGYMNASLLAVLLFIPIIILESQIGLFVSFDFANNLVATNVFTIFFMGVLLLTPLVFINIKKFQRIKALDALKDML